MLARPWACFYGGGINIKADFPTIFDFVGKDIAGMRITVTPLQYDQGVLRSGVKSAITAPEARWWTPPNALKAPLKTSQRVAAMRVSSGAEIKTFATEIGRWKIRALSLHNIGAKVVSEPQERGVGRYFRALSPPAGPCVARFHAGHS